MTKMRATRDTSRIKDATRTNRGNETERIQKTVEPSSSYEREDISQITKIRSWKPRQVGTIEDKLTTGRQHKRRQNSDLTQGDTVQNFR